MDTQEKMVVSYPTVESWFYWLSRRGTRGYWRGRLVSACPGTRGYENDPGERAVAVHVDVRRLVGDEEPNAD